MAFLWLTREKLKIFPVPLYLLITIIAVLLLNTIYYLLFFNASSSNVRFYHLFTEDETQYELLSYNNRVKQNIIDALASQELMSESIPPLRTIRRIFMMAPKVRLTLCPVPKSMSIVSMNIFCYLYDPIEFVRKNQSIPTSFWHGRLCQYTNELEAVMDRQNSFGNHFDHTISIVRDPFSRFISGYIDKCINSAWDCFQCAKEDVLCILTELKKQLERGLALEEYRKDKYHILLEHMAPQTWYCEMKNNLAKIIFVKYGGGSHHDQMVKDLIAAFRISRVPEEQVQYIQNELNKDLRTEHTTEGSDYKTKLIKEFAEHADWKDLFFTIFKNDYKIFEFEYTK